MILNGDDPLLEPLRASLPFQSVLVGTAEGLGYRGHRGGERRREKRPLSCADAKKRV